MFEFSCPICGKRVRGDDSLAGKYVLCPVCNIAMTAPPATPRSATAVTTPKHAAKARVTTQTTPSNGEFSDGLPPHDPGMPSIRKAVPHILTRMVPIFVVVVVVVTAVLLMMPALSYVRDGAARTQSTNNLKHVGLAMHNFHDIHKRLPFNGTAPAKMGDATSGSWEFQILPGLDHQPLFMKPDANIIVSSFCCPGRGRPMVSTTGAWSDYCINPFLNDPNGVVNAPDAKRSLLKMPDGASNTIFAGHGCIDPDLYSSRVAIPQSTDIFKGGDPATARRSTTNHRDTAGDASLTWGSPLRQGSYFLWCDGTVRLMSYSLTGGTVRNGVADGGLGMFLTPAGGELAVIPD